MNIQQLLALIGTVTVAAEQIVHAGVLPAELAVKILAVTGVLSAFLPKLVQPKEANSEEVPKDGR